VPSGDSKVSTSHVFVTTGMGFGDGVGGFGFGVDDVSTQLASASAASQPTVDSLRNAFRDGWVKFRPRGWRSRFFQDLHVLSGRGPCPSWKFPEIEGVDRERDASSAEGRTKLRARATLVW
jgi:hypothetical protein